MNSIKCIKSINFWTVTLVSFSIYVLLFLVVHLTGINPLTLQSDDIVATSALPFSIIKEGNLDLDEYHELLTKYYPQPDDPSAVPHYFRKVNGHYYNNYPMFTSFVAVPLYIVPAIFGVDQTILGISIMSRISGAFITALSVGFMYLVLKEKLRDKKQILLLLVIYAFATNSLSISSQGLWQHGTSQLMLSIGLLALIRKQYGIAGLFNGFAYWGRPTNLLPVAAIGLYILYENRKEFKNVIKYSFFASLPMIADLLLSLLVFGSITNTEYGSRLHEFNGNVLMGFLGMWISPSKGILTCSPVFLFMLFGFFKCIKDGKKNLLMLTLSMIIVIHTVVLGRWYSWFGGYAWGYRMASDLLPYMIFMLIPFIQSKYFKVRQVRIAFYVSVAISISVQLLGIAYFDSVWHTIFDGKGNWLWSISNSQINFSIKRLLFKFNLVKNPIPIEYRVKT